MNVLVVITNMLPDGRIMARGIENDVTIFSRVIFDDTDSLFAWVLVNHLAGVDDIAYVPTF